MITVRLYQDGDWEKITDAIEPFSPAVPTDDLIEFIRYSLAATGLEDGKVFVCGGITCIGEDDGVIWLKMSKQCRDKAYRWARSIKEAYICMKEALGIRNVHTYIIENFCQGDKMARMIGMRRTGEYEEYNGNNYYKYTVM